MNLTILLKENFQVPNWQAQMIFNATTNSIDICEIIVINQDSVSESNLINKSRSLITQQISNFNRGNFRQVNILDTLGKLIPIKKIELTTNSEKLELCNTNFDFLSSDSILLNLSNLQISNADLKVAAILSPNLERIKLQKSDVLTKNKEQKSFELIRAQIILNQTKKSPTSQIFEGFSRVHGHSQSKTLAEAINMCAAVFRKSLEANSDSQTIEVATSNNWKIISSKNKLSDAALKRTFNGVKKVMYGMFCEKRWKIAKLDTELQFSAENIFDSSNLTIASMPVKHYGAADPCGIFNEYIYCELLSSKTGKGVLGRWGNNEWELINFIFEGHISYPQIIESDQKRYLFPEVSQWSSPVLFELDSKGYPIGEPVALKGLKDIRALDGTLFRYEGNWYLFAGKYPTSHERLNLYYSSSLFGEFIEHPQSPIILDPRFSRMGGEIVPSGNGLVRFSQDCSEKYGSRLNIFEIRDLGISKYHEVYVGSIAFSDVFGPHAISKYRDTYYLDFYTEEFSFFAGYRRLRAKFL
jgi:hypothetical protein